MREIKFRGKRVDNGEWVVGSHIFDALSNTHFICGGWDVVTNSTIANEVIPETVGQYTSGKDKNDKEIYEGDKVRAQYVVGELVYNSEITYRGNGFCVGGRDFLCNFIHIEVIGNIHDTT